MFAKAKRVIKRILNQNRFIYINDSVEIITDKEAKEKMKSNNDSGFVSEKGIVSVPVERWQTAQKYERTTWMEKSLTEKDDRNFHHARNFDFYKSIENKNFESVIELGCGPFTNLRIIAAYCNINNCTLLDPLINDYLLHPNCQYNTDTLKYTDNNNVPKQIKVKQIMPSAIEQADISEKFDLLVIINVIEHCYDINVVFEKVYSLLKKGGIIIFHDKYYEAEKVKKDVNELYDAGHPLRVDKSIIDDFIGKFNPRFENKIKESKTFMNRVFSYENFYFIGEK